MRYLEEICEMKLFGPLARAIAIAGLATASVMAPAPAYAGPAELALLESYIGVWSGRGELVGAETEPLALPGLERVGPAQRMQPCVGLLHVLREPGREAPGGR